MKLSAFQGIQPQILLTAVQAGLTGCPLSSRSALHISKASPVANHTTKPDEVAKRQVSPGLGWWSPCKWNLALDLPQKRKVYLHRFAMARMVESLTNLAPGNRRAKKVGMQQIAFTCSISFRISPYIDNIARSLHVIAVTVGVHQKSFDTDQGSAKTLVFVRFVFPIILHSCGHHTPTILASRKILRAEGASRVFSFSPSHQLGRKSRSIVKAWSCDSSSKGEKLNACSC